MKRVAIMLTASLRSSPAGTYTPALVDLVERLSSGYALTVFTVTPPSGESNSYSCGGADVRVVPVRYDASIFRRAYHLTRAFRLEHGQKPFDLVHGFWAIPGGLAAVSSGLFTGIPSIVTLQGGEAASLPSIGYGNMSRASTRALTLWICRHSNSVTGLTRFQAEAMAFHGLKRQLRIIPYGAPESFYCGPRTGLPGVPLQLLHVADLNRVKDQGTLLRAVRIIIQKRDARLTIVGRDLLDGRIARLAAELGIGDKVRFLGYVHHSQLPALYFSADILLHTSLYEAQGVVVSEACAAGCVVCGSRVGLVADLEGTGAVAVPPEDPQALADAVIMLMNDPERWRTLRSAAASWATQHSAAWTAAEFSKMYEEILNF